MLISYKHKFIFIHNYKVAGISVNIALRNYSINNPTLSDPFNKLLERAGPLGFFLNRIIRKAPLIYSFDEHVFSSEVRDRMSHDIWNGFYKFGIVRNPWDWQVSLYHYILEKETHWANSEVIKCKDFEDYICSGVFKIGHQSQHQFFTDEDGNIIVDFIAKLESLQEDMAKVGLRIGLPIELPRLNQSKHKDYKDYYSDVSKTIIEEYYKTDCDLFGYQF